MRVAVGQVWTRKVPENDGWDQIAVVGVQGIGLEAETEFSVRPVGGLDVTQAPATAIEAAFELEQPATEQPAGEEVLGTQALEAWL
jgi:hypothetical protein